MTTHEDELRAYAKGTYTEEAAVELLIRGFGGVFAKPGNPWVHKAGTSPEGYLTTAWVDWDTLADEVGPLSGGERRYLLIASSLAGANPVMLSDVLPGLDRKNIELVLAAVSHANGSHEHSGVTISEDGTRMIRGPKPGPLFPWPDE